jgi:hypothetical protein
MKRLEGKGAAVTGGSGGKFALALALTAAALSAPVPTRAQGLDTLQYSGSIAFSPEGVLFVGDNVGSAVFAYKTDPNKANPRDKEVKPFEIDQIDSAIARAINVNVSELQMNDMAVHPITHEVYFRFNIKRRKSHPRSGGGFGNRKNYGGRFERERPHRV